MASACAREVIPGTFTTERPWNHDLVLIGRLFGASPRQALEKHPFRSRVAQWVVTFFCDWLGHRSTDEALGAGFREVIRYN